MNGTQELFDLANTELEYHNRAKTFAEYLKDSQSFEENHSGQDIIQTIARFKAYIDAGITPDDLRQIGDRMAEARGSAFDFEKEIRSAPTAALILQSHVVAVQQLKSFFQNIPTLGEVVAGSPLSAKKINAAVSGLDVYLRRNALDKELVARRAQKQQGSVAAEKLRNIDISTWRMPEAHDEDAS